MGAVVCLGDGFQGHSQDEGAVVLALISGAGSVSAFGRDKGGISTFGGQDAVGGRYGIYLFVGRTGYAEADAGSGDLAGKQVFQAASVGVLQGLRHERRTSEVTQVGPAEQQVSALTAILGEDFLYPAAERGFFGSVDEVDNGIFLG